MTPRQRVVKYLVQITRHKTVEDQLRQQWLQELAQIQTVGPKKPIAQSLKRAYNTHMDSSKAHRITGPKQEQQP